MIAPANNRLSGREGIDAKIHNVAGQKLEEKIREISNEQRTKNLPPCPVTSALITKPYGLSDQIKHLIHVVGPDCRRPNQDESRRILLPQAYETMFEVLKNLKDVKTVVAPPISMGIFAYPHREGARY